MMNLLRLLWFLGLNFGVWIFARGLTRRLMPPADPATRLSGCLIFYFYTIVVGLTLLPKINLLAVSFLAGAALVLGCWLGRNRPAAELERPPLRSWMTGLLSLLLGGSLGYLLLDGLLHPRFFHDPMTYQLTFAAEWLQQGKITLVPTPFGDPSQAYAPSNPSLYYLWLMLPLHADTFALIGQFPFALLAFAALAGLAKLIEAPRPWHLLAPLLLLASPMFREQAASAYSDLALAALFAASLFFYLRAWRTKETASFMVGSMALGLMLGTKYNSLPLLALVLPAMAAAKLALKKSSRHWFLLGVLALLLILAGGGYWYARNFWLTGSPVYPFRVDLGHWNLIPGVYGRPEMLNWIFHHEGYSAWRETMQTLTSRMLLLLFSIGIVVITPWLGLRGKIQAGAAYLLFLPLLIDRINWWVVPFQVDRFWMPALVLAPLSLIALTLLRPRLGYLLLALTLLDLAAFQPDRPSLPEAPGATRRERAFLAWEFGPAWNALAHQPGNFTVAYAGNNMPYPLYGPKLDRKVRYVSVKEDRGYFFHEDAQPSRFHDMPKAAIHLWPDTPEPAPYRRFLILPAWLENLKHEKVDYLFVTRLSEAELVNIEHDEQGWPTEKVWADRHPELFETLYQNALVRIYRMAQDAQPNWTEEEARFAHPFATQRPLDALEAYARSREEGESWFPLAPLVIQKYHLHRLGQ